MASMSLTFDAVNEATPGPKWLARWNRSWPAYEAWFLGRGGDAGPSAAASRDALQKHMPELVPVYDRLVALTGGGDRAARFLSTWCPPKYLGGCSLAAMADGAEVRLVRNYDLSPDLNEGLLLRTEWGGRAVMGMVEFLWGLSDGINDAGLSVALAYGGRSCTGPGFGITTILRYVLETCDTVAGALKVLRRVPSHMDYNLVLADASGATASVEMIAGGGMRLMPRAIATNHQSGSDLPDRAPFTRTYERHDHLSKLRVAPDALNRQFLQHPLHQDRYGEGFGTLFTAEYNPATGGICLHWQNARWEQSIDAFEEGSRVVDYARGHAFDAALNDLATQEAMPDWSRAAQIDWQALARDYANGCGREVHSYLPH
ncbi:C45 family autoproteolytic acyltransferase/hydolase [Puniceibacterium sediminis]|uniref:Predicted choloylglycine hydrolase n=1 Tax=Puniceibacterium sediminis TaxID=1608407 RepID=A0A238Z238_9RHOB|nr:C45 family peptidase [Puniceibacterium sediminis]SNR77446.1 Predicted choloylglycine hydrolase [Puniceibacterium sediminis]